MAPPKTRIVLIYPPPWQIPPPGKPWQAGRDGPPEGFRPTDLDTDFYQIPQGLLSLAAQARAAGYPVKVLNLSATPWPEVEQIIAALEAQLYGLSCWTANRRGVALVASLIRRRHPSACIVAGGPHAGALAEEMLRHHQALDLVAAGESEHTFLELCRRLSEGLAGGDIAGTVVRAGGRVRANPPRQPIADLDSLIAPQTYFDTHVVMTARGCPWSCTFCGAEAAWGRGVRHHSVAYVLDALEQALGRLPVRLITIKDDTFTTDKKRVLALCRGIRERRLSFIWSCDTRADLLSEELLREMRLAGCERLSFGVESGAPEILARIGKRISLDKVLESTATAKSLGFKVRYYLMLGNRGETARTMQQTIDLVAQAKPHEAIYSCLSIYPGTQDFRDAEAAGWLEREVFFTESFQELKAPFDASEEDAELMNDWFSSHSGLQTVHRAGVDECRAILGRLPDHHAAQVDLGAALYRAGQLEPAERHLRRALELGYPLPGLVYCYLGCSAAQRGDLAAMQDLFSEGARLDPQHYSLIKNVETARAWFRRGGPAAKLPLKLEPHHDFQLLERTRQPLLPGPVPADFAAW